jgi:hypothetical protein
MTNKQSRGLALMLVSIHLMIGYEYTLPDARLIVAALSGICGVIGVWNLSQDEKESSE